jgi:hypothetical protein
MANRHVDLRRHGDLLDSEESCGRAVGDDTTQARGQDESLRKTREDVDAAPRA